MKIHTRKGFMQIINSTKQVEIMPRFRKLGVFAISVSPLQGIIVAVLRSIEKCFKCCLWCKDPANCGNIPQAVDYM